MPKGWRWDATLYRGAAPHYARGRLPYPSALAERFRWGADLSGAPRLIDVGCGPGTVAVALAGLFAEVIGVDPDPDMLVEAAGRAADFGVENVRWVHRRAEALPAGLGHFRYATFAQSFHWMEREVVAEIMFRMIEPGGAFVHVNTAVTSSHPPTLPFPSPPRAEIDALVKSYLGEDHRAGQSVLRYGTPDGEARVLVGAGFRPARSVSVKGGDVLERSVGVIISWVLSHSNSAPHLFGDDLARFEDDLRHLLDDASDQGRFSQWPGDFELNFYDRPAERS